LMHLHVGPTTLITQFPGNFPNLVSLTVNGHIPHFENAVLPMKLQHLECQVCPQCITSLIPAVQSSASLRTVTFFKRKGGQSTACYRRRPKVTLPAHIQSTRFVPFWRVISESETNQ